MRIGIVTQSYLPIHGGVAQHVFHQMTELEKRGHDVWVITANFYRSDEQFNHRTIRIGRDLTTPGYGAFVNSTIGWHLAADLKRIEAEKQFDIVHVHNPFVPFLPFVALRVMHAPIVGTFHSRNEHCWPYDVFGGAINYLFAPPLRGRIVVSEAAKEFYLRYFPGDYRVIPNGVDTERFSPDAQPVPEFKDGKINILFVGRMDPRKGLPVLLEAFDRVAAMRPHVRLIVVGGGVLRHYYESLVNGSVRDRVKFVGYVSEKDLPRYYRTADIYVSPATGNESFGVVLVEALASGTPVVASAIPGYQTVITDSVDGRLVPPRDPNVLAAAIVQLIDRPEERARLSVAGRKAAERYAWPRVVDQIEGYYDEVLRARPPRSA